MPEEKKELSAKELKIQLAEKEKKEIAEKKHEEALAKTAKEKADRKKEEKKILNKYVFKPLMGAITVMLLNFHFKGMQTQIDQLKARLDKIENK